MSEIIEAKHEHIHRHVDENSAQRQAKKTEIEAIRAKIEKSQSFVVINYRGLTVEQDTQLRKAFREQKVEYKVLKNTLVRIALNELGYKEFDESLNGPTAVAFGMEDAIAPAKVTSENMEKFKALEVKCGMMDNKYVDAATVAQLAKVPSKPALLSMLLSVLQAPVRGLAVSLNRVAEQKG